MSRKVNGPNGGGGTVGKRQSMSGGSGKYGNFLSPSVGGSGAGGIGSRNSISGGNSLGSGNSGSGGIGRLHSSNSSSARDDLSEQRFVLSEPPDVYPLPSGNHLPKIYPDFEPWKRTKEEDLLVLECLQRGHHQQAKVSNESSSGKASMIPLLKQWTSLPALSFFLVNAMEIRERNCRISSNWTFKPPPRVTLTDQKREAWLRDLASPSVPLRRLSRTIPHGIRNRGLLEQCCNKSIPIQRAVWFARCVGANELRGLKRKGMGSGGTGSNAAELAWIRDWSEEVVGYIEKLVKEFPSDNTSVGTGNAIATTSTSATTPTGGTSTPATPSNPSRAGTPPVSTLTPRQSWKFKIEYITRLSTYLFYEQLLDRDIFLKWSLKFLHNSLPEELPISLIFIRTLWKELISNRTNSQLLALALLHQHSSISKINIDLSNQEPFITLLKRLADYIKELLIISSDSFVMPKNWRTLGPVLNEVAKSRPGTGNVNDSEFYNLLETIRIRNESLLVGGTPLVRASRNGKSVIIDYLDNLKPPYGFDLLAEQLPSLVRLTPKEILETLFSWSTTKSRVGREKIFICLNLCLKWKESNDWEISPAFLSFLIGISNLDNYDMNNVYDLVAEFVDHKLVSLGGYFRLVISSGVLFVGRLQERATAQMLILDNLPLLDKRDIYISQQQMLLSGLRKDKEDEGDGLESIKVHLKEKLKFLFEEQNEQSPSEDVEDDIILTKEELDKLQNLKKGSKVELSDYLIESFNSIISKNYLPTLSQFAVLQKVFEQLREIRALCHIIWVLAPKITSGRYLYFLANTVLDHLLELSALNHLDDLIQLFITQYHSLKAKTRMSKGLWDLIQVAIGSLDNKPELKAELEFLLKPNNVCSNSPQEIITLSPMSESNSLETPKTINIENEITMMNKLGIQLDEAINVSSLPKYFNSASTLLLESCKTNEDESIRTAAKFLQQLRDIDLHIFDDIFNTWLRDQVEPALLYDSKAFTKLLLFCVIYECVSLEKIADIFMQLKSVRLPGSTVNSRLMMVITSAKDIEGISLKPSEELLLDVQRRVFERSNSKIYLKYIVQEIINENSNTNTSSNPQWYQWISPFLLWLSTVDFNLLMNGLVDPILEKKDAIILNILRKIINKLLFIKEDEINDEEIEIINLIKVCNDFNISLCQVQIKVILENLRLKMVQQEESDLSFIETASRILLCCASKGINLHVPKSIFGDLIIHVPKGIKGELLYQCEVKFLKSTQFPIVQNDEIIQSIPNQKNNIVGVLLEIVDAIADCCTKDICISHVFDVEKCLEKLISVCEGSQLEGMKVVDYTPLPTEKEEMEVDDIDDDDTNTNTTTNTTTDISLVDSVATSVISSTQTPNEIIHYSKTDIHDAVTLFVKIVMIHFHSSPPQSQQGNLFRDKIIQGFSILHDTAVIKGLPDLSGLLLDALNAIREDFSTTSRTTTTTKSAPNASSPLAGRSHFPTSSNNSTPTNLATNQHPTSNALAAAANVTNTVFRQNQEREKYYLSDLVVFDKSTDTYSELKVRSFDLLEEGNPVMSINDAPLNLAMFDSATERNNPS